MEKSKLYEALYAISVFLMMSTFIGIIDSYEEIKDLYLQKKENYQALKDLQQQVLRAYQIDYSENEKLLDLQRAVAYDEHMISSSEPDFRLVNLSPWILTALGFAPILIAWIYHKCNPSGAGAVMED